jgi:tryptophan-rich sensory protein
VGSLLPILQGWLFFLLGILLLSHDVPLFARIAHWLRGRFPRTTALAERLRKRISRRGIRHVVKEELAEAANKVVQKEVFISASKQTAGLFVWFALVFGAAWVGSLAKPGQWYAGLQKPGFNPPDWVFGVVWPVLYAAMAASVWLVWKKKGFFGASIPLTLFFLQLGLNVLWPWLFFEFEAPGWAFFELVILWFVLLLTLASFWVDNPPSAALLVPYLAWVTFAAILNLAIWRMNA